MDLAIRLKREDFARRRIMLGFTSDAAVARKAGMHPQYLSQILLGNVDPTLSTVSSICQALSREGDVCKIEELVVYEFDN